MENGKYYTRSFDEQLDLDHISILLQLWLAKMKRSKFNCSKEDIIILFIVCGHLVVE